MKPLVFSIFLISFILPNVAFGLTAKDIINHYAPVTIEADVNPGPQPVKKTDESLILKKRNPLEGAISTNPTYKDLVNQRLGINPNFNLGAYQKSKDTSDSDKKSNSDNKDILDQIVNFSGMSNPVNKVLNQLYYVGLIIAVILAIIMIIRGGLEYMTIDAAASKETGKRRVQAALGGLLLAFSAILILRTINPKLTDFTIKFNNIEKVKADQSATPPSSSPSYSPVPESSLSDINSGFTPTTEGVMITPNRVSVDTDGYEPPPFNDPDYQPETSYGRLNANTDNYVVVPIGSDVPLGTRVYMFDENTQQGAWGIVGDRGPTKNGYGEISLHAAQELGAWQSGMGNSVKQHKITYTYYTKEGKK